MKSTASNDKLPYNYAKIIENDCMNIADQNELMCLKYILEKAPIERENLELDYLRAAFKNFKYFDDLLSLLEESVQMDVLREVKISKLPKAKAVFEEGTVGRNVYIILKGSVYITAKTVTERGIAKDNKVQKKKTNKSQHASGTEPSTQTGSQDPETSQKVHKQIMSNEKSSNGEASESKGSKEATVKLSNTNNANEVQEEPNHMAIKSYDILSEASLHYLYPMDTLLATLYAPNYFGEIALNTQQARTATVVCREECLFATLSGVIYQRVLGDFQEAKSNEVLRFFTNIPIMKDWGTASVSAVIRGVVLRTFNKGDELYKEDDRANCVYIVKEGEIEITKKVLLHEKNKQRSSSMPYSMKANSYDKERYQDMNSIWKNQLTTKSVVRVAILGKGELVGESDLVADLRKREYTATCHTATVEVYEIDRKIFVTNARNIEKLIQELKYDNPKRYWRHNFTEDVKKSTMKATSGFEYSVSPEKVADETTLKLKSKMSNMLHCSEELSHVIRERNLKKPELWLKFQTIDPQSTESEFEQNRIFKKEIKSRREQIAERLAARSPSPTIGSTIQNSTTRRSQLETSNIEPVGPSRSRSKNKEIESPTRTLRNSPSLNHIHSVPRSLSLVDKNERKTIIRNSKLSLLTSKNPSQADLLASSSRNDSYASPLKSSGHKTSCGNFFALTNSEHNKRTKIFLKKLESLDPVAQKIHKILKIPQLLAADPSHIKIPESSKHEAGRQSYNLGLGSMNAVTTYDPSSHTSLSPPKEQKTTKFHFELPKISKNSQMSPIMLEGKKRSEKKSLAASKLTTMLNTSPPLDVSLNLLFIKSAGAPQAGS